MSSSRIFSDSHVEAESKERSFTVSKCHGEHLEYSRTASAFRCANECNGRGSIVTVVNGEINCDFTVVGECWRITRLDPRHHNLRVLRSGGLRA